MFGRNRTQQVNKATRAHQTFAVPHLSVFIMLKNLGHLPFLAFCTEHQDSRVFLTIFCVSGLPKRWPSSDCCSDFPSVYPQEIMKHLRLHHPPSYIRAPAATLPTTTVAVILAKAPQSKSAALLLPRVLRKYKRIKPALAPDGSRRQSTTLLTILSRASAGTRKN